MKRFCLARVCHTRWTALFALFALLTALGAVSYTSHAALQPSPVLAAPQTMTFSTSDDHEGLLVFPDRLQLLDATLAPPMSERGFQRYGFYVSSAHTLETPASRLHVAYDALQPAGSDVRLDVRGSASGQHWTAWETDVDPDSTVDFGRPVQLVQYRATLLGSTTVSPVLSNVSLAREAGPARYQIQADAPAYAPTFTIRATRLGMIGGRTANGHIIQPYDRFVALPSWRSLNAPGGHEYQVRITYKGRSVVAPVWDVGPWNTTDDYWSTSRQGYPELPQGWPQDHAAYYDGHNGGYAEKGYVRFPTAMDVGDGLWWELGIPGDQGQVHVTYLWLGEDPQATPPPPDPNASEFRAEEHQHNPAEGETAIFWNDGPTGCGEGGSTRWTYTTTDTVPLQNEAYWQPELPTEGLYDVYVHVPICPTENPATGSAYYRVTHRDGEDVVTVNQTEQTGWVLLGQYPFSAGNEGAVRLSNITGDSMHVLWFDDAKWVPVR